MEGDESNFDFQVKTNERLFKAQKQLDAVKTRAKISLDLIQGEFDKKIQNAN